MHVETAVPGKWGYRCTGMSYINFPRMLLCTMNNGVDLTSNKRFTKGYGYFTEMESYEELLKAWDKTIREITRYSVIVENVIDKASERDVPDILCSALTDDCIARGKTIKEGGAVYDFISGLQVGIANMADCLAEGCSPAHNSDKNGPTAVFKSVSKLRTNKITGGVLLNQKMTPQMLSTEENRQKLELLIKTFFNRLHGYHVQYNIVSKETLIDAQKHPEKHKDLIVRVAGYSAFFNVLSKKTQDDIIGRTEQSLM